MGFRPCRDFQYTQTLHGTAIYAAKPPQLIGSPMAVPWSVWDMKHIFRRHKARGGVARPIQGPWSSWAPRLPRSFEHPLVAPRHGIAGRLSDSSKGASVGCSETLGIKLSPTTLFWTKFTCPKTIKAALALSVSQSSHPSLRPQTILERQKQIEQVKHI